jgi:hypothetical protein
MITHLISLTALVLLFGFAWHNRTARGTVHVDPETEGAANRSTNRFIDT